MESINLDTLESQTVKALKGICTDLSILTKSSQKKADIIASICDFVVKARITKGLEELDNAIATRSNR